MIAVGILVGADGIYSPPHSLLGKGSGIIEGGKRKVIRADQSVSWT